MIKLLSHLIKSVSRYVKTDINNYCDQYDYFKFWWVKDSDSMKDFVRSGYYINLKENQEEY